MTDPLHDPGREDHETAEDLDEDALGVDPLEEGMDPAENWSSVTRTRHDDVSEPESLDERLAEEEPDVEP
ncbi:MAG: hypothetical protein LLG14_19730 [Nocardiaceae bacterium]|nr:hypothetical protein [Nocardiaceae bacterium]